MCLVQKVPVQKMPDPVEEEKKRIREADEMRRRMFAGRGWESLFNFGSTGGFGGGLGDMGSAVQRVTLGV